MNKTSTGKPEMTSSEPEVETGNPRTNTATDMAGLTCQPVKRVFFLKTSKTGSTTVANIMARFAFKYNLDALLGLGFLIHSVQNQYHMVHIIWSLWYVVL